MRVNLISHDNGYGLRQDVLLMEELFRSLGHVVSFHEWRSAIPEADANVFLELFDPELLDRAPVNVGIFNLAWFLPAWQYYLPALTQVWAKSVAAYAALAQISNATVHYSGFLSRDVRDPAVARQRRALHVCGRSTRKGTKAVLRAWHRHHSRLPPLTLISSNPVESVPPSVSVITGYVSQAELDHLRNSHWFSVCPSEQEGWGHGIAEAVSAGALVVTTNASPMNEHVRPRFGALLPATREPEGYVSRCYVDADDLADAVAGLADRSDAELRACASYARLHWERRRASFFERATELVGSLAARVS